MAMTFTGPSQAALDFGVIDGNTNLGRLKAALRPAVQNRQSAQLTQPEPRRENYLPSTCTGCSGRSSPRLSPTMEVALCSIPPMLRRRG
jgi:hypothetical protein